MKQKSQYFSIGVLKLQVFGVFSTKKSKFASLELVCLLTSSALLCGIQARDQVLQRAYLLSFFCPSIPKRDLDTKKTPPNIEVCPESLGAMLEY